MFLLCSQWGVRKTEHKGNKEMIKETQRIIKFSNKNILVDTIACGLIVFSLLTVLYLPSFFWPGAINLLWSIASTTASAVSIIDECLLW